MLQVVIEKQYEKNVIVFIHIKQEQTFGLIKALSEIGWQSRPHVFIRDSKKHDTYWACWDPRNVPKINPGKRYVRNKIYRLNSSCMSHEKNSDIK